MRIISIFCLFLLAHTLSAQETSDRGFIHPGGLYTQADFDRVKAQLAAKNLTVAKAWSILRTAEYAQSNVQTNPVETIVRGGGSGENYMNAARGAAMAYQNALRWKIAGTTAHARAAIRILMAWCNTTKEISGNSDQCLAVGIYGYQFAQAAELMRDYEGWNQEDFEKFQLLKADWHSLSLQPTMVNRWGSKEQKGKEQEMERRWALHTTCKDVA